VQIITPRYSEHWQPKTFLKVCRQAIHRLVVPFPRW